DPRLSNRFIDLRCRSTAGDTTDGLPIDLNRHSPLVGEGVGEHQALKIATLELVRGVLGRAAINCGVPSLLLGELDGVEARSVGLLKEEQVTTLVDNTDRDLDVSLLRFRFGSGH